MKTILTLLAVIALAAIIAHCHMVYTADRMAASFGHLVAIGVVPWIEQPFFCKTSEVESWSTFVHMLRNAFGEAFAQRLASSG